MGTIRSGAPWLLFLPAVIAVTSLGISTHWTDARNLQEQMHQPLVRIFLFVLISLTLFHWAHRFRFTLVDFGLKSARQVIAVLCYGAAIVGTLVAGFLLVTI